MPSRRPILALALAGLVATTALTLAQTQPPRPDDAARPGAAAPGERRPDVMGRVATVSPDGKRLTINVPPRSPTDGQPAVRPEPTNVTLTDRTQLIFFGVGDNEARPAPGLMAMVWLDEGSRDQAARVRFMKREGEERPDVQGRVLAVSPDGRTVTVETRDPDGRPGAKVDLHIAPYTQSLYYGVDREGARPTTDYLVLAWLEKGTKDVPVRIRFAKNDGRDFGGPGGPGGFSTPPR